MSKLNKDILFLLFEELQNNSKFLFSCLMVNRLWCETVISVLWKDPWRYDAINYRNKSSLYSIITFYLSNDIKEFLKREGILISSQSLAFDYLSFCRSINVNVIDDIITIGSSLEYNQFLLQEEIYGLLIRKCPEIKWLNVCGGTYQIVYIPEAKTHLESLCELTCDTSMDPNYLYKLARVCQYIQRIIIINKYSRVNHGTTKLIEVQKNLKYFKWKDSFDEEEDFMELLELLEDPYSDIFQALKVHANTLNHFEINIQYEYDDYDIYNIYDNYDYTFLQNALLGLHKLKTLKISSPIFLNNKNFREKLEMITYNDLEIFEMDEIDIYQATCIIKNSKYLRKFIIHEYYDDYDIFEDVYLNIIQTIYENCYLVEYLSIPVFPLSDNHFIEFEKLLKKCQNLRSLYFKSTYDIVEKELEYGEYLLNVLVRASPIKLREIEIPHDIRFSLKTLETFFEKWRGRPAISIRMRNPFFYQKDYMKLINKYKIEGVIKHFSDY
jgi:hypothetical protein